MGVASLAVVVLTVDYGRLPWVALVLAFSFGSYGLAKKTADVGAIESLAFETAVIAPFAAATSPGWSPPAASHFAAHGVGHALLLMLDRHRHRDPADLLRRRRHPGLDGDASGCCSTSRRSSSSRSACSGSTRTCRPAAGLGFALVWVALVMFTFEAITPPAPPAAADRRGIAAV